MAGDGRDRRDCPALDESRAGTALALWLMFADAGFLVDLRAGIVQPNHVSHVSRERLVAVEQFHAVGTAECVKQVVRGNEHRRQREVPRRPATPGRYRELVAVARRQRSWAVGSDRRCERPAVHHRLTRAEVFGQRPRLAVLCQALESVVAGSLTGREDRFVVRVYGERTGSERNGLESRVTVRSRFERLRRRDVLDGDSERLRRRSIVHLRSRRAERPRTQ